MISTECHAFFAAIACHSQSQCRSRGLFFVISLQWGRSVFISYSYSMSIYGQRTCYLSWHFVVKDLKPSRQCSSSPRIGPSTSSSASLWWEFTSHNSQPWQPYLLLSCCKLVCTGQFYAVLWICYDLVRIRKNLLTFYRFSCQTGAKHWLYLAYSYCTYVYVWLLDQFVRSVVARHLPVG
jgi:hypothetical protein